MKIELEPPGYSIGRAAFLRLLKIPESNPLLGIPSTVRSNLPQSYLLGGASATDRGEMGPDSDEFDHQAQDNERAWEMGYEDDPYDRRGLGEDEDGPGNN